jgi:hypothetical protein
MESAAARAVNAAIAVMTRKMGLSQPEPKPLGKLDAATNARLVSIRQKAHRLTLGHKEPVEVELERRSRMALILAGDRWRLFRRVPETLGTSPSALGPRGRSALTVNVAYSR